MSSPLWKQRITYTSPLRGGRPGASPPSLVARKHPRIRGNQAIKLVSVGSSALSSQKPPRRPIDQPLLE